MFFGVGQRNQKIIRAESLFILRTGLRADRSDRDHTERKSAQGINRLSFRRSTASASYRRLDFRYSEIKSSINSARRS